MNGDPDNGSPLCPSEQELSHLLAGDLSDKDRFRLESHVDDCSTCQELLAAICECPDTLAWREALRADDTPDGPEAGFLERLKRARPFVEVAIEFPGQKTENAPLGQLESYQVIRELGQGGMAIVFLARDSHLDSLVALKILKPELAASSRDRERFFREGRAAAAVRHDNIVRVHRADTAADFPLPYLVMEYIDGQSVHDRQARQGALPPGDAAAIARQVALGLSAAHARGLVHRDVKPSNIMLEADAARAKVTDFGLARAVDAETQQLTQQGGAVGTPAYMSPEHILNPQDVDARSDVYSLGAVMYEMLTGVRARVAELVIPCDADDSGDSKRGAPTMAFSRRCKLFAASAILPDGNPVLAVWDVPSGRLLQQISLRAETVAFAPDESLFAAGDAEGHIAVWTTSSGERTAEVRSSVTAVSSLAFGPNIWPDAGPNGAKWLLASGDASGNITIWDIARQIPRGFCRGSEYHVFDLQFSTDGITLASCGRYVIRLWDVATGRLLLTIGNHDTSYGLALSPDNRRLAFSSMARFNIVGGIRILDLTYGRGIRRLRGLSSPIEKAWFSRDDKLLAALSHNWRVAVWNLQTGELQRVVQAPLGLFVDNSDLAFSPDGSQFAFSAGQDATLWETATGHLVRDWPLPKGMGDCIRFDGDGRLLLFRYEAAGIDEWPYSVDLSKRQLVCRLRNLLGNQPLEELQEVEDFNRYIYPITGTPDGSVFVIEGKHVGPDDRWQAVLAVDTRDSARLWSIQKDFDAKDSHPKVDPSGRLVYVPRDNQLECLVDIRTGSVVKETGFCYHFSPGAEYASNGRGLFHVAPDGEEPWLELRIGDDMTGRRRSFSHDGDLFAWGTRDGSVYVCNIPQVMDRLAEVGLGPGHLNGE